MTVIMTNHSFRDPGSAMNYPQVGTQIFASIAGILDEYVDFTAVFKSPGKNPKKKVNFGKGPQESMAGSAC